MKVERCCDVRRSAVIETSKAGSVFKEGVYQFVDWPDHFLIVVGGMAMCRLVYRPEDGTLATLSGLRDELVVAVNKKVCFELRD